MGFNSASSATGILVVWLGIATKHASCQPVGDDLALIQQNTQPTNDVSFEEKTDAVSPGKRSSSQTRDVTVREQAANLMAATYDDFSPSSMGSIISKGKPHGTKPQILYVCVMLSAACILCVLFAGRGLASCVAILCNVFALSVMSLLVRNIYVNCGFHYPKFVTGTHALCTFFAGLVGLAVRRISTGRGVTFPNGFTWMFGVVPIGIAFALSLTCANMGLLYANAHFYEMLGASGFLVTAFVGWLMGKSIPMLLIPPMLVITVGAITLAAGSVEASALGATLILSAVVFRAVKAQMQSTLMTENPRLTVLDPLELVVATSIIIFVIMLTWSLATEGTAPWELSLEPGTAFALLLAAGNAATINIACLFVIRSVGPVAQQGIGQLKGVLCCIGSVAAFHEQITNQEILGYAIVIAGILWFNTTDLQQKAKAKANAPTK